MRKSNHIVLIFFILPGLLVTDGMANYMYAGIFSRSVKRVIARKATRRALKKTVRKSVSRRAGKKAAGKIARRKATGKSIGRKSAHGAMGKQAVKRAPQSLYKQIVREANTVAAKGGRISRAQAETLVRNLPVVKRRGVSANKTMRSHFASTAKKNTNAKKYLIHQWERNRGHKWPRNRQGRPATPHHIIPLESGGANKWWNAMPTFGKSPNHSLKGLSGPHAKGNILRKTIQAPRKKLQIKGKNGRIQYREFDLRRPYP